MKEAWTLEVILAINLNPLPLFAQFLLVSTVLYRVFQKKATRLFENDKK